MELLKQTAHHFNTDRADALADIHQPEFNLAILNRTPTEEMVQAINELLTIDFEPIRISGKPKECLMYITEQLATYNLTSAYRILADIETLVEQFVHISESSVIKIFFGKVENDLCKRFHTDINDLRMLCTYNGIGTVWTENSNIQPKHSREEEVLIDKNNIHFIDLFHVGLLKGALHRHSVYGGIFHRSPSMEEAGGTRILLRIDTNKTILN